MSAFGKVSTGSEVSRRMYFAASTRVQFLAALAGILAQALLLGFDMLLVFAPDHEAQHQWLRWRSSGDVFVDANLDLAFLFGLRRKRCKQIKRLAVQLQQP